MPDGSKIVHLTVGGRTTAVVPSVQKKTGAVAGDIKSEQLSDAEEENEEETVKGKKGKATTNGKVKSVATEKKPAAKKEADVEPKEGDDKSEEEAKKEVKKKGTKSAGMASRKRKALTPKEEDDEEKPAKRQNGTQSTTKKAKSTTKSENIDADVEAPNGTRRRSGRVSKGKD